jgi:hypothetical protein
MPITPALLTSGQPCSAVIVAPFTLDNIQDGFDFYSWLTFIALNSPDDGKTVIGKGPGPGGDATTIWEKWKDIDSVMRLGGIKPTPWGAPTPLPRVCKNLAPPGTEVISQVGKTPNVLSAVSQPFKTGPLIDQNGHYVRYDIMMNEPMFDYIVEHGLYSQAGQQSFTGTIDFPPGDNNAGGMGAIMIKLAWKVLGTHDDRARFHAMTALVYTKAVSGTSIKETCHKAVLGLVGMHIGHKTLADPQWVWSSFEHVDNDPTAGDVAAGRFKAHYNFYDAKCKTCVVNEPPPRPWNPNVQPFPHGYKSQIVRVIPLTAEVERFNSGFQSILKGTVWQNYMLISTQWPTDAKSPTDPTGRPAPTFLANTTAETYIQGRVPQSSSNCIECHNNATTTAGRFSDFTYILENAHAPKGH